MSVAPAMPAEAMPLPTAEPNLLPTLMGEGDGTFRTRPSAFVFSFALNILTTALVVWSGHWFIVHRQQIGQRVTNVVTDISPYILPASAKQSGGGGGGGDRDKLAASRGQLPKQLRDQMTPPTVVVRKEAPKLAVDASVVAPPIQISQMGPMGDPLSKVLVPSNGTGYGSGIGSGSGGGVGSGRGPGVGPGWGGGVGGGPYRVGGGVSAPVPVFAPDPEYSEEARKAKYQGTVVLTVIVSADGRPRDIRVQRSLGLGLDEKAIEAVRTWKFDPARKDGQAVDVLISVEVSFRLY